MSQETRLTTSQWADFDVMIGDLVRKRYLDPIWVQELRKAIHTRPIDIEKVALYGGYITLRCCEELCRKSGINPTIREPDNENEKKLNYPFRIINILLDNALIDITQANYAAGLLIEHSKACINQRIDPKNFYANLGVMYIFVDKTYFKINEPLLPDR